MTEKDDIETVSAYLSGSIKGQLTAIKTKFSRLGNVLDNGSLEYDEQNKRVVITIGFEYARPKLDNLDKLAVTKEAENE
jgi:hypothetical protein